MDSPSFESPQGTEPTFDVINPNASRAPRGFAWLAWLVVTLVIGLMLFNHLWVENETDSDPSAILFEIQARYLVGASSVTPQGKDQLQKEIELMFGKGSARQRMIGAVLMGELIGPEQASKSLSELDVKFKDGSVEANDRDRETNQFLQRIQSALIEKTAIKDAMTDDEWRTGSQLLIERLGWVGRLALVPLGTPDGEGRGRLLDHSRRTLFVILGISGLAFIAMICGAVLQLVFWIFAATGRLKSGIETLRGNGAIYAETFAVWMVLFMALNYAVVMLPLPKWGLVWILIPQIGGLGALAWPVLRGISWSDVRKDVGLSFGRDAWSIPFVGIGGYLSALPVVGVAMVITLLMMAVASSFAGDGDATGSPIHPIVEPILRGNWTVRLQLLLVAVFASVPEEIMFRGVLYRHLRDAGSKLGYVGSVIFAMLLNSFVFAVIHPQGLFGIPILMSLAMVFTLVREWRGTIIPSIIAHALVNAGTSTMLLLIAD